MARKKLVGRKARPPRKRWYVGGQIPPLLMADGGGDGGRRSGVAAALNVWLVSLQLGSLLLLVIMMAVFQGGHCEARGLLPPSIVHSHHPLVVVATSASTAAAASVKSASREASAMLDLRISLSLGSDGEWPELSDPCATWKGVRCEDGHVVEVRLEGLHPRQQQSERQQKSLSLSSIGALGQLPFLRSLNASGFAIAGSLRLWLGGLGGSPVLEVIDLGSSSLTGPIPSSIGQLANLKILRLANNSLTGVIPPAVGALSSLTLLDLSSNHLRGPIPATLGGLSQLQELNLSFNRLHGYVPPQLGNLGALRRLLLAENDFRGPIPEQLGDLRQLTYLDLSSNSLTGEIPAHLGGGHELLTVLNLGRNELEGDIPLGIANCSRLEALVLSHNGLTGPFPTFLGKLKRLRMLDLASNGFSGPLSGELFGLSKLESLLLSNNLLVGSVPRAFSRLKRLRYVDLSGNYFSGSIPPLSRTRPSKLRVVIMDRNCFSSPRTTYQRSTSDCRHGYLGTGFLPLYRTGSKQKRVMKELLSSPTTSTSTANPAEEDLASSSALPASSSPSTRSRIFAILGGVLGCMLLIVVVGVAVFYVIKFERKAEAKKRARRAAAVQKVQGKRAVARKTLNIPSGRSINVARLGEEFSYEQLEYATGQFDLSNMIMAGHTGDLYKGVLNGSVHVVVKRIDVGRFKKDLYMSELEFFGRVSHSRLVPLLGHCLEKEDEKLLVYKYMPNGDLAYALHRKDSPSRPEDVLQSLDWITRLKIAIGVAEGLEYLHHECSPPLVHRDVKASSILLDDKFEVRLGSLTDARVQQGEHHPSIIGRFLRLSKSSDQLDASVPPASCAYDVFCFGKVLLELVSGKLGISGAIDPGADAWLDWAMPLIDIHDREPLLKLMDKSLIVDEDLMEEVWATAIIAKSCLNPKSSRRPNMKHILRALENPQKVVRDDHSGPMKSRHSSYGSWNSALFGGWRHFSSDNTFGFQGSLREEQSFELTGRGITRSAEGSSRYHRRPSREIFPAPQPAPGNGGAGAVHSRSIESEGVES